MKRIIAGAVFLALMCTCTCALADAATIFDGFGNLCGSYDTDAAFVIHGINDEVRQYDSEGKLIQVGRGASGTAGMCCEYGNVVVRITDDSYDAENVGSVLTLRTVYEYGDDGRMALAVRDVEIFDSGNNEYGFYTSAGFRSWRVQPVYDYEGNAYIEWPDGMFEEYADGRLVRSGAAGIYETVYEYDSEGRLIKEGGLEYVYDETGRLVGQYFDGETIFSAEYVEDGSMILTWEGGQQYVCDAAGRVIEKRYTSGDMYRYEYDSNGRIICEEIIGSNGSERTEYNYHGLPTLYECDLEWDSRRIEYTYAEDGFTLLLKLEYPEPDACIETHFDENGRISSVSDYDGRTETYEYAEDGSVTVEKCDAEGNAERFEYYPSGTLKGYYASDGSYTEYDEAGYTVRYVWEDGTYFVYEYFCEGDELKAKRSFYDDDGNLMSERLLEGDAVTDLYR